MGDEIIGKMISMISPDIIKEVVTMKHLRLKEGKEIDLLYVLLHVMLCGPRGTGITLKLGKYNIVIRELFEDFSHRGWLTWCKNAVEVFSPKIQDFKSVSPYFRVNHKFWPTGIDIESEMKSRRDFFNKK